MTDHGIEELERQVEQARGKLQEAQREHTAAIERRNAAWVARADAEFAERGITVGSRVFAESKTWSGTRRSDVGVFTGHKVRYSSVYPIVHKLTKSGHPHKSHELSAAFDAVWHLATE